MPTVIRTLLAPVLLVQGRRMFKAMPRLPEPPGERSGTSGSGPPMSLLVAGDSSAAGVGAETQHAALLGQLVERIAETHSVSWELHARFGSTIPKTTAFLKKQPAERFDVAVLAVGMNDMIAGESLSSWLNEYRELVKLLRERFYVSHIILSGMPLIGQFPAVPQPLRWVLGREARKHDHSLSDWADSDPGLTHIGLGFAADGPFRHGDVSVAEVMASDGFHPGPRVYAEWARRAVEALRSSGALEMPRPTESEVQTG